jgi:hypothetical protein
MEKACGPRPKRMRDFDRLTKLEACIGVGGGQNSKKATWWLTYAGECSADEVETITESSAEMKGGMELA